MIGESVRFRIEMVVEAGDWSDIPADAILADLADELGRRERGAHGTAVIALANDATVHDLNLRFRSVDRPSNVLSFPSEEVPGEGAHLGDVVLSSEILRQEADAEAKPLSHHFAHLALHGLLHLFGYDHQSEEEAQRMEALETDILDSLSISDPYSHDGAVLIDQ